MSENIKSASLQSSVKRRIAYIASAIFLIMSPWILLFISVLLAHGSIKYSIPLWSDEMSYWHEVFSLHEKGLNFGYYSFCELIPKYLSFGTHGFGTLSAYLPYSKLFGWDYNSMVLANNFYISVSFILLVSITRPSIKKILLIAASYLTYMPLILYNFTSMSELLNYASLITYFVLLYTYLKAKRYKNLLFILLLIFTAYISFIRVIYIVLFLPILMERFKVLRIDRQFWKASTIWVILSVIIYYVNTLFVSPFPYSFLSELFASSSISGLLYDLQKHFFNSIVRFFSFKSDTVLQVLQRYFIVIMLGIFLWKSEVVQTKFKKWNFPFFIAFLILILVLIINFAAYDVLDWRDYRAIAPIFFGLIVFIALSQESNRIIKYAISINIAILSVFIFILPSSYRKEVFARDRYRQIEPNYDLRSIEFDENTKSKFDNTIIVTGFNTDIHLNIPGGIGISACFGEITDDLKSRYIYSSEEYDLKTYKIIKTSPKGILYKKTEDSNK